MNATLRPHEKPPGQWIGLGDACGLLGVNESTLRHWADAGRIRSFRTVGGHRRFAREDIVAFQERGATPPGAEDLGNALLKRLRRRLQGPRAASHQLEALDERGRARLRVLGRRLVDLALQYHQDRRRRPQLLEDARFIGEEYAAEFARRSIGLSDALASFVFHRSAAVASVRGLLQEGGHGPARGDVADLWEGMVELTDAVMLSLVEAYGAPETPVPAVPTGRGGR